MPTVSEALQLALRNLDAGRAEIAEDLCRRVLAADPRLAEAHHLLGAVCHRLGRLPESIECFQQAVALRPNWARAHCNLGAAHIDQGDYPQAIASLRRALELTPGDARANGQLSRAYYGQAEACCRRGLTDKAIQSYQLAIQADPNIAEAHNDLATVLYEEGRLAEAAEGFHRALALRPDYPDAHYNLGLIHHARGEFPEAVASIERALRLKPDYPEAVNNLGCALQAMGKLDEAMDCYRRALKLRPGDASAYNNMGTAWHARGDIPAAVACLEEAIRAKPDYAEAQNNLGCVWQSPGKLDEALACYEHSLELDPHDAKTHTNLGTAWHAMGETDAAIACYEQALRCDPEFIKARQNLLCTLQYRAPARLVELQAAHAEFERCHAASFHAAWQPHANRRDPDRPLRLGFLSADLGRHPVGTFLVRVLENLDRRQCEIVCYNDRPKPDDLTARFQAVANTWRDVLGVSDQRLAEQIRNDGIDMLFDLAGHTLNNRLLVFARKPAPIQLTWIGYVGTTGLRAMDYLVADRHHVPVDAEPFYCETVLRMPDGYVCFDPPADAPPVEPLPAAATGRVTFGSLNNPAKISPLTVAAWSQVLRRVEGSRLILKYRGLHSHAASSRLRERFAAAGLEPERLELLDWSSQRDALACYGQIDVALDTFPYSGGLTTCEALWMGAPVVTCPGETFAGRHSLSHLSTVGLTETIAGDLDQYVDIAVRLASDLPRLADLRANLRPRVAASPLCDGPRFAENLLPLLRRAWHAWVVASPPR
jgi:predicted O-linked N-acetylglucosamine transferase (SPINDLY family)